MICPKCGEPVARWLLTCLHCGHQLKSKKESEKEKEKEKKKKKKNQEKTPEKKKRTREDTCPECKRELLLVDGGVCPHCQVTVEGKGAKKVKKNPTPTKSNQLDDKIELDSFPPNDPPPKPMSLDKSEPFFDEKMLAEIRCLFENWDRDKKPIEIEEIGPDRKRLRVMEWNIERLGGEALFGVQPVRPDAVILAIAKIIHQADPHLCAIIEVMAHNGESEVQRIVDALNFLAGEKDKKDTNEPTWGYALIPGETGEEKDKENSGETYGVIYKLNCGIAYKESRFALMNNGKKFDTPWYPSRGTERSYRAPGELFFTMSGQFADENKNAWTLPLVLFHAPGPTAHEARQKLISEMITNLGAVASVSDVENFPDCLICADLNADEDGRTVVPESLIYPDLELNAFAPDNSLVTASEKEKGLYHTAFNQVFEAWRDVCKELDGKKTKDGEDDEMRDELDDELELDLDGELDDEGEDEDWMAGIDVALSPGRKRQKVWTKMRDARAKKLLDTHKETMTRGIEKLRLTEVQEERRKSAGREWRQEVNQVLEEAKELDVEPQESLASLAGLTRVFGEIQSREAMQTLADAVLRPSGEEKARLATIKREFTNLFREQRGLDKMKGRAAAFDNLYTSHFYSWITYDDSLPTTRRRSVTSLRGRGAQGVFSLPRVHEDLHFSNYDQILPRCQGHLREPTVKVLPILAAVMTQDQNDRLAGGLKSDLVGFVNEQVGVDLTELKKQIDEDWKAIDDAWQDKAKDRDENTPTPPPSERRLLLLELVRAVTVRLRKSKDTDPARVGPMMQRLIAKHRELHTQALEETIKGQYTVAVESLSEDEEDQGELETALGDAIDEQFPENEDEVLAAMCKVIRDTVMSDKDGVFYKVIYRKAKSAPQKRLKTACKRAAKKAAKLARKAGIDALLESVWKDVEFDIADDDEDKFGDLAETLRDRVLEGLTGAGAVVEYSVNPARILPHVDGLKMFGLAIEPIIEDDKEVPPEIVQQKRNWQLGQTVTALLEKIDVCLKAKKKEEKKLPIDDVIALLQELTEWLKNGPPLGSKVTFTGVVETSRSAILGCIRAKVASHDECTEAMGFCTALRLAAIRDDYDEGPFASAARPLFACIEQAVKDGDLEAADVATLLEPLVMWMNKQVKFTSKQDSAWLKRAALDLVQRCLKKNLEPEQLRDFFELQVALASAKHLSDHNPLVLDVWVYPNKSEAPLTMATPRPVTFSAYSGEKKSSKDSSDEKDKEDKNSKDDDSDEKATFPVAYGSGTRIEKSDYQTLNGGGWLSDEVIRFWFRTVGERLDDDTVVWVPPATTRFIQAGDVHESADALAGASENDFDLMLFPLNNNNTEKVGGRHWSLLVYDRTQGRCFHFDSAAPINKTVSENFAGIIQLALDHELLLVQVAAPQQANGSDCGVHVLLNAEAIATQHKNGVDPQNAVLPLNTQAAPKRTEVQQEISLLPSAI